MNARNNPPRYNGWECCQCHTDHTSKIHIFCANCGHRRNVYCCKGIWLRGQKNDKPPRGWVPPRRGQWYDSHFLSPTNRIFANPWCGRLIYLLPSSYIETALEFFIPAHCFITLPYHSTPKTPARSSITILWRPCSTSHVLKLHKHRKIHHHHHDLHNCRAGLYVHRLSTLYSRLPEAAIVESVRGGAGRG